MAKSKTAKFKTEPGYTGRELPALGHHATFRPGTNGVSNPKPKQKERPRYQPPPRSLENLSPEEQVFELKQSRKAIKSKLYGRIARLQVYLA
jgi:hypothetical protein